MSDVKFIIVDGFDMVGKSAIGQVMDDLGMGTDRQLYRPDYTMIDELIPRAVSGVLAISVAEMIRMMNGAVFKNKAFIINRGLATMGVYNELYNKGKLDDGTLPVVTDDILSKYGDILNSSPNLTISHISHSSLTSAEVIYRNSTSAGTHTESFDQFPDFETYWSFYKMAEDLYDVQYKAMNLDEGKLLRYVSLPVDNGKSVILKPKPEEE